LEEERGSYKKEAAAACINLFEILQETSDIKLMSTQLRDTSSHRNNVSTLIFLPSSS
jgi:hypothetical protein